MMKKIALMVSLVFVLNMVAAQGGSVDIELTKIKTEPTPVQTSEYADIWLKVVNRGNTVSESTEISFKSEFPFSADPDEKTSWDLGRLVQGEEYRIHLQVKVDENAVHGTNQLMFDVSSGDGLSLEKSVDIEVRTDDEALSISRIDFPAKVGPGTSNVMTMTVENMADSYLKNIDVSLDLSSESLPFVTSESTTRRIQKIAPGEKENVSFRISIDEDAENGVYKLPVDLDYENEAGTSFSKELMTGVVVGGESELEVGINTNEIESAGKRGSVTFRIVNRGEGRAKFAELRFMPSDDYEILSSDSFYIGNVDSDDYQTAEVDMYIKPNRSEVTVPVEISYKDSEGMKREEIQEISMKLYSPEELASFSNGGRGRLWTFAVIGVLLIGGIYYWRKRKR